MVFQVLAGALLCIFVLIVRRKLSHAFDMVYRFKEIIKKKAYFSDIFKIIYINSFNKVGNNLYNKLQTAACLAFNPFMIESYAAS